MKCAGVPAGMWMLFAGSFRGKLTGVPGYDPQAARGASEFVRQYTLAAGGPYCDCGYKKKVTQ